MGTEASGRDPFSHDRTMPGVTVAAVARAAWLRPADRRAARSTVPATKPRSVALSVRDLPGRLVGGVGSGVIQGSGDGEPGQVVPAWPAGWVTGLEWRCRGRRRAGP